MTIGGRRHGSAHGTHGAPARIGSADGTVDRIIRFAEKDRFGVVSGFVYLLAVISTRAWLEATVLEYHSVNLYYYAWQITFFAAVFMGTVMALKFFSGAPLRNSLNVVLLSFWIIILPPLLDLLVFHASGIGSAPGYSYLTKETILDLLFPFGAERHTTWGLIVQGWYVAVLLVAYLWGRTKSLLRTVTGSLGIYLLAVFMGSMPLVLDTEYVAMASGGYASYVTLLGALRFPILSYYGWLPDTGYIPFLIYQQRVLLYIAYNLLLFILFFAVAMRLSRRDRGVGIFGGLRVLRMGHFALMVLLGALMVRTVDPGLTGGLALNPAYILHVPYIILMILALAFTWQFTTMINDIYDTAIDGKAHPDRPLVSGRIRVDDYRSIGIMFGLLALSTSAVLGLIPFLLICLCLLLGVLYSVPPFRLRSGPWGNAVIGLGSMLAYFVGVYSPDRWVVVYWDMSGYEVSMTFARVPPLSAGILVVGLIIFVALTVAPVLTQLMDYEGDMEGDARSLPVVWGPERTRKFLMLALPVLFLLPLLVIHEVSDVIILSGLAVSASLSIGPLRREWPVFLLYGVCLAYCIVRVLIWPL